MGRIACVLALGVVLCAGCASEPQPIVERSQVVSDTATVEAIDVANRQLTLKGSNGRSATFDVDEHVRNLPELQVGDKVVVDYIEGGAVYIGKPGTAPNIATDKTTDVSKPGEKPSAVSQHRVTLVALVEAIDENAPSVTLRGRDGHKVEVKVEDPDNLKKVKVGETVQINYTQSLAVSVHRP